MNRGADLRAFLRDPLPRRPSTSHKRHESEASSEGEFVPNPEYADIGTKGSGEEEDQTRSLLFRHEQNGIIVYDSKARYSDLERPNVQMQLPKRDLTEDMLKDLDRCQEYGNPHIDRVRFVNSPQYPPWKYVNEEYTLVVPSTALRFDSKFESGNLAKAVMVDDEDYTLTLEYDIETKGFTQWCYSQGEPPSPLFHRQPDEVRIAV